MEYIYQWVSNPTFEKKTPGLARVDPLGQLGSCTDRSFDKPRGWWRVNLKRVDCGVKLRVNDRTEPASAFNRTQHRFRHVSKALGFQSVKTIFTVIDKRTQKWGGGTGEIKTNCK